MSRAGHAVGGPAAAPADAPDSVSSSSPSPPVAEPALAAPAISIDDIARKLLRENFYLTALELHCELSELGAELPRLRSFFSNPGNFERQTAFQPELAAQLPRSSSQATLDSIELGRFSEDGERLQDERTAVLEFELRKAQETIKSLRANLTGAAELATPDQGGDRPLTDDEPIKPHEQRALNFLVNEYLLRHGYKLSSIALCDEIADQDVEDWDDVGLNIARPPELLHFFREAGARHDRPAPEEADATAERTEGGCQTEPDLQMEQLQQDAQRLTEQIRALESQLAMARATAPRAASDSSDTAEVEPSMTTTRASGLVSRACPTEPATTDLTPSPDDEVMERELAATEVQNRLNCIAENARNAGHSRASEAGDSDGGGGGSAARDPFQEAVISGGGGAPVEPFQEPVIGVGGAVQDRFQAAVLAACVQQPSVAGDGAVARLLEEVGRICVSADQVVLQLARCLPHVAPHVILARREELLPLLLTAVQLHPGAERRDQLLGLLFSLVKRPDHQQRALILAGVGGLARRLPPGRLEEEVLPQCWEQISHKYPERRLLVAEACAVLAPVIQPELRSSLVWSMLHQMVTDEREETVRQAAVRALAVLLLYCHDADADKLTQAWELTCRLLEDRCQPVQRAAAELLLPVVASWARRLQLLHVKLVPHALSAAQRAAECRPPDWTLLVWLQTISLLLDHVFLWLVSDGPHVTRAAAASAPAQGISETRLPPASAPLCDLGVLYGQPARLRHLVAVFDNYVSQEWFQVWPALDWLLGAAGVGRLLQLCDAVPLPFADAVYELSQLLRRLAQLLGPQLAALRLWPAWSARLRPPAAEEPAAGFTSSLLPAVGAGLLTAPAADAEPRLARLLQDALYLSATCRQAVEPLAATVRLLLDQPDRHPALLELLWKGVMHAVTEVRENTAEISCLLVPCVSDVILTSRVLPALVTLASDPQPVVRRAAVAPLGLVLETRTCREATDKARLQLSALAQEPLLGVLLVTTLSRAAAAGRQLDFCLPLLAEVAARRSPADAGALLQAYTALACGRLEAAAVQRHVLPPVRALLDTLVTQAAPEADDAAALLRDFEHRAGGGGAAAPATGALPVAPPLQPSMEEVRSRVSKMLSASSIQSRSSQLTGLFKKK